MGRTRATLQRRRLGAELRRLRETAEKQQQEVARILECDVSQVSRVESGDRSFKVREIEALLDLYKVPAAERSQITELAKIARQRQPRRMYSDAMPGAFRRLSDHEQDATEILYSDGDLIPGLLQTEDYARAMMRLGRCDVFKASEDDVEARVRFRMERKELLAREGSPRMCFVLGEAAVRRPVGGRDVLREQLVHLLELIEQHPHIVVQVAPLAAAEHPLLGADIEILRFGGLATDVVHQPTYIGGGVYLTDERDIDECTDAFDQLRAVALGPDASRAFIARQVEGLGHDR